MNGALREMGGEGASGTKAVDPPGICLDHAPV